MHLDLLLELLAYVWGFQTEEVQVSDFPEEAVVVFPRYRSSVLFLLLFPFHTLGCLVFRDILMELPPSPNQVLWGQI